MMDRRSFIKKTASSAASFAIMKPLYALAREGGRYTFSDAKADPYLRQGHLNQMIGDGSVEYINSLYYMSLYSYLVDKYYALLEEMQNNGNEEVFLEISEAEKREYSKRFFDLKPGISDLGKERKQDVAVYSSMYDLLLEDEFDTNMKYVDSICKHIFNGLSSSDGRKPGPESFNTENLSDILIVMASYDTLKHIREKEKLYGEEFSCRIRPDFAKRAYYRYASFHYRLNTKLINKEMGEKEADVITHNLELSKDEMP